MAQLCEIVALLIGISVRDVRTVLEDLEAEVERINSIKKQGQVSQPPPKNRGRQLGGQGARRGGGDSKRDRDRDIDRERERGGGGGGSTSLRAILIEAPIPAIRCHYSKI